MSSMDQLIECLSGSDPIAGAQALHDLVALGAEGEEALFSRPIKFPRTVQACRRWLRYVASREDTVVSRLLDRMRNPKRFNDAYASAHLFAGVRENSKAIAALDEQISADFTPGPPRRLIVGDWAPTSDRFQAYGYAGGNASNLWHFVKDSERTWEKLATFAFRGACAEFARLNSRYSRWAIEQLITHQWEGFDLVEISNSPDALISRLAIDNFELGNQADRTFMTWRRGDVADEILSHWSQHAHWRVRHFGAQILASLSFQRTVKLVAEWLRREPVDKVRISLLDALQRSATASGADALIEHYLASNGEGSSHLAKSAWRANDKNRAMTALSAIADGKDYYAAESMVSLARLGHRHGHLIERLESPKYYIRLNAALAVAYLDDRSKLPALIAMGREAASSYERICLATAVALLGKPNGAQDLHELLIASADLQGLDERVDIFFLHGFLKEAILDGLAAGGADASKFLNAWRSELEPLAPVPQAVAPVLPKSADAPYNQLYVADSLRGSETGQPALAAAEPLNVFISYSHQDEKMRIKLGHHLAPLENDGLIRIWHDRQIEAGGDWEGEINKEIGQADIILLLVSAPFLSSRYCRKELLQALSQRSEGKSLPIPIILRPCDWTNVFNRGDYKPQALPRDDRPVASKSWRNQDAAFAAIAMELRAKIEQMRD